MEKNKHKFIYFILILILTIITIGIFISIFSKSVDRNSYVELVHWEWYLNDKLLVIWEKNKLSKKDFIETKTKDSLAVIEWWDWSITRLWWNTKLKIENEFVSNNKNQVNILFRLFSWKTWSNVVSYFWEDSYFKQTFNDTEMTVRWTIYSLDLENNYIQVESHKVNVNDAKLWTIEVTENKQLNINDFTFISLDDFIKYFKDKSFFEINKSLDKEYFDKLTKDIIKNIDSFKEYAWKSINDLTFSQREILYKEFLEKYQELNFIWLKDSEELFNLKMILKDKLIELTPESWKSLILKTLSYDIQDMIDMKNLWNFELITDILKKNDKYIDFNILNDIFKDFNINFDINTSISNSIDSFKQNVIENPKFKDFFNSFSETIDVTIKEQKNLFRQFLDFLKNLFV